MALTLLCPNCGHRESVNEEGARRKARCPECGVVCPLTESKATPHRPAETEDEEDVARRLLDEVNAPAPKPAPRRAPALPPAPARSGPAPAPRPPPVDEEDEDDGKPYAAVGGEERRCQKCQRVIAEEAVLCVHCGLDFRKGKKIVRTYEPLRLTWDLGMTFPMRRKLFPFLTLLGAGLSVGSALWAGAEWTSALIPILVLTVLLAFLLGTFFHAELERDKKGKAKLTRTWRVAFIAQAPVEIDLFEHEGVRVDQVREAGLFEWLLCINLLLYAIVPGVLWWYHVIYKDRWLVVLTRDHGHGFTVLFRGNDGVLAKEVAATLRDAARLREETH